MTDRRIVSISVGLALGALVGGMALAMAVDLPPDTSVPIIRVHDVNGRCYELRDLGGGRRRHVEMHPCESTNGR